MHGMLMFRLLFMELFMPLFMAAAVCVDGSVCRQCCGQTVYDNVLQGHRSLFITCNTYICIAKLQHAVLCRALRCDSAAVRCVTCSSCS